MRKSSCHEGEENPPCTYAEFVKYISSDEALLRNDPSWEKFSAIFDAAENTPLVETSQKLREAGFRAEYEQERLYPKDKEAKSVPYAIRKMRGIATGTKKNKFVDQKTKMIEALELAAEVRRADNMKYFIPVLEEKMGIKMELKETKSQTRDGLEYQMYDEAKTAEKNKGVEDLAQKVVTAADGLRKQKRKGAAPGKQLDFVIHQTIMREIEESIGQLKQKCP
ncbi:hypothetical protein PENANT_c252G03850 [Penicillium antarcticum]|uniref:Uncharacterized protein n=1 Tax=Penicillium antarcticum TaxID=416450 RepID=A0A1V6P154_9EURO|nr:hypothetical protein PENANT_c252G03850 [Penicillium antarcticum]